MTARERFATLVQDHVRRRRHLERDAHEAAWQLSLTGDPEHEAESQRLETALKTLLSDREVFATLTELKAADEIRDPRERRQLEVLLLEHAGHQVSKERIAEIVALEVKAEAVYAAFRANLDGRELTENEVRRILRESDGEVERRSAWEASKRIGHVMAPLILDLVGLRNAAAAELGYRDHYAMALALQEIDEGFLFDTLADLEERTAEPYRRMMERLFTELAARFGTTTDAIRPWHLADAFFQEAVPPPDLDPGRFYAGADLVALTRKGLGAMGFDIEGVLARSDLFPRAKKNQHAFCTHIDRATDDVRVLCNIAPDDYWMDTMLHEFGHAVYDCGLGEDLPWVLRQAAHTLSTESVAILFGRLATDPDWMIRIGGAPAPEVDAMRDGLARFARAKQLIFPRWVMVMCHFERALYADPSGDLGTLWWDLVERFQNVPRPEGRDEPDWACKVHLALAPVYYHNYLLGDLMASQLAAFLTDELGTPRWFERPETARLLRERLFRHGASYPWNETLRLATGSLLEPAHYVRQYITAAG